MQWADVRLTSTSCLAKNTQNVEHLRREATFSYETNLFLWDDHIRNLETSSTLSKRRFVMKQTKKKVVWLVALIGIGSIQVFGKPFAVGPYFQEP